MSMIEVWTSPKRLKNGSVFIAKFTAFVCALMIESIIAISAEMIWSVLGMNEQHNTNSESKYSTKTNIKNIGSNAGRLYTHTDLKLMKNGGGSQ